MPSPYPVVMRRMGLILCLLQVACGESQAPEPAALHHYVFFTLKDAGMADDLARDCMALGDLPGVVSCNAGRPLDTGRAEVTADYSVGFHIAFSSEDAYRAYLTHPRHVAVVKRWKPHVSKIEIRDVVAASG